MNQGRTLGSHCAAHCSGVTQRSCGKVTNPGLVDTNGNNQENKNIRLSGKKRLICPKGNQESHEQVADIAKEPRGDRENFFANNNGDSFLRIIMNISDVTTRM